MDVGLTGTTGTAHNGERPARVLIVDDDTELGKLLTQYLSLAGAFEAQAAESVQALWKWLGKEQFDVILLDYNLPDGDGLSVLLELTQRGYNLPVVMVTGEGDERTAAQAIQRGALEYVIKDGSYEFIKSLPGLVQKTLHLHALQVSAQRSLEKIQYQAFLLNNVQDAIVVWNLEGKIMFLNFAAQRLFGWRAEEKIGQHVHAAYFNSFVPALNLSAIPQVLEQEIEHQYVTRHAAKIWVSSRITPVYEMSQEQVSGYMNVSRDITDRKRMQAQVQAAQAQLVQSVRLTSIGELASGIAHQINNPLTTIIADAQILLRQIPAGHPAWESAHAIEEAGWRTQKIVQLLLDFSRPPTGALETLPLNLTIENALTLVGAHLQSVGAQLKTELAQPSPTVFANQRQLEDLWVHLLFLARDAIRNAKSGENHISIKSYRLPEQKPGAAARAQNAVVEVHDTGALIPAEQMATLFEPNLTLPTGGRGSGIELSICREIVRQAQGQIHAVSSPKEGTTIWVQFPCRG